MKPKNRIAGASLLAAFATFLCCITSVYALVAGASSLASIFSWMEPLRP